MEEKGSQSPGKEKNRLFTRMEYLACTAGPTGVMCGYGPTPTELLPRYQLLHVILLTEYTRLTPLPLVCLPHTFGGPIPCLLQYIRSLLYKSVITWSGPWNGLVPRFCASYTWQPTPLVGPQLGTEWVSSLSPSLQWRSQCQACRSMRVPDLSADCGTRNKDSWLCEDYEDSTINEKPKRRID